MGIPSFPDSRPLELTDRPLLDSRFEELQPRASELTFAGLYLFRRAHAYRICRLGESLVLLGRGYDGTPYALPPLGGDTAAALAVLHDAGTAVYGADEALAARIAPAAWEAIEERDAFDYLYLREELATLPGNRFHKKRNRISYFGNRHDYRVAAFGEEYRTGCHELLDNWQRLSEPRESPSLALELEATAEAICLAIPLGLTGVVILVDDAVKAFALGERLNRETAVCHFEKADPFMEGLAQLVNREFCRALSLEFRYVNREQDLGESGLRQAKLSYHPVELVRKFRLVPQKK